MASRKLLAEIEKLLKKVDEGVIVFEQIWDKVYSASNAAQKEKYEGDLKKEIKKLQRLRDQIKTWQGDSSIKDKSKIDSARKIIEEKMERFKVCEKETKTKAFSKEGLAQDRTDPKERAKREVGDWITGFISRMNDQIDEFEAEIEALNSAAGKRKGKNAENPKAQELRHQCERHLHHIEMLEKVLRAVDNEAISVDEANELQDQVDYYIENNQEPDFIEDEEMYDHLDLDHAIPAINIGIQSKKSDDKEDEEEEAEEKEQTNKTSKGPAKSPPSISPSKGKAQTITSPKKISIPDPSPKTSPPPTGRPANVPVPPPLPSTSPPAIRTGPLLSAIVKGSSSVSPSLSMSPPEQSPLQSPPSNAPGLGLLGENSAAKPEITQVPRTAAPEKEPARPAAVPQPEIAPPPIAASLPPKPIAEPIGNYASHLKRNMGSAGGPLSPPQAQPLHTSPNLAPGTATSATTTPPGIPGSVLTATTLSPSEISTQVGLISGASQFLPESPVSDLPAQGRQSSPRNPTNVPSCFPTTSASIFDNPGIFESFDVDTLFFIFSYQQGTYQQYLAARELKRQSWRFHKKYLTWFQRHEEPKVTTDTYEQGTYVYFDYVLKDELETGWCQRIKSEFVFDYEFLEDEPMK